MSHVTKTREEIQVEVHRLVHLDPQVIKDKVQIHIPAPVETDPIDGCNWAMAGFGNADNHMDAVTRAMNAVMDKWRMKC